jgi:hypothetical protein
VATCAQSRDLVLCKLEAKKHVRARARARARALRAPRGTGADASLTNGAVGYCGLLAALPSAEVRRERETVRVLLCRAGQCQRSFAAEVAR